MSESEHEHQKDKAIENLDNNSRPENPFVDLGQIARRYSVCKRTIQNMMRVRAIPYHRISKRCVRFKVAECDAALERFKRDCVVLKGGRL